MKPFNLAARIKETQEIILDMIMDEGEDRAVVSFSGGKDSSLILHFVREFAPNMPAVFCDTGVEAPETYAYVKTIPNLVWIKPKYNFWEIVEERGWPKKKGECVNQRANYCCHLLKEKPMKDWIKANQTNMLFDGLTRWESTIRRLFFIKYGYAHRTKKWHNVMKVHAIYDWRPKEVLHYLRENNIPYNSLYDPPKNAERVGCQPCTAYKTWQTRLKIENEPLYRLVLKKRKEAGIIGDDPYDYEEGD